jgi:hypothetical protein
MTWTRHKAAVVAAAVVVLAGLAAGALLALRGGGHARKASVTPSPTVQLRQFGRPAFAFSGATPRLLPYIHRTARIVDLYAGTTRGYYRDLNRVAPHNLYAHTRQLLVVLDYR